MSKCPFLTLLFSYVLSAIINSDYIHSWHVLYELYTYMYCPWLLIIDDRCAAARCKDGNTTWLSHVGTRMCVYVRFTVFLIAARKGMWFNYKHVDMFYTSQSCALPVQCYPIHNNGLGKMSNSVGWISAWNVLRWHEIYKQRGKGLTFHIKHDIKSFDTRSSVFIIKQLKKPGLAQKDSHQLLLNNTAFVSQFFLLSSDPCVSLSCSLRSLLHLLLGVSCCLTQEHLYPDSTWIYVLEAWL